MITPPLPEQSAADVAKLELFEFRRQALIARLELDRLKQDVAKLGARVPLGAENELRAANEQLLLSTLRTQARLDDYEHALAEAARNATRDPLTQLPNRALLFERLDRAIAAAQRQRSGIAVLFVDLNGFKQINDLLGHATGDECLRLAAERITAAAGPDVFVARYGGDEFVLVLDELDGGGARHMVAQLSAGLGAPCMAGEHELRLGASIGISLYPNDGDDGVALLQHADDAMYCAKRQASGFRFYGECSTDELHDRRLPPASAPSAPRFAQPPRVAGTEELRQANSQLVLAALTAQELQAAAEQAVQRQNEMLAFVAHELRNPLTPIRIAGSMLDTLPSTELRRMQQIIEHEVVHMNRLIGDLLDVSRVRTGKLRILKERMDLHAVVEAAATACRAAMDARQQRFELRLPSRPLLIHGDAIRLSQVLRNLLDNASKYTPEGGWIGLTLRDDGPEATIVVSDSGIGISADALQRIFEPFVQDPHAVGFNGAGLGIGLTVVREILAAHGGSVGAYSAGLGLGCEFAISLPLPLQRRRAPAPAS